MDARRSEVVTLFAELDLTRGAPRRAHRVDGWQRAASIGYDDLFVHAAARALSEHTQLIAVAGGAPGGTIDGPRVDIALVGLGPRRQHEVVIANADAKTLPAIAAETSAHAEALWRDEDAPPAPPHTFSIANLGAWGIERCTGTLRAGQRAQLTLGEVRPKPVCTADGRIESRTMASVGLTIDSGVLDPIEAACFLETLQLRLDEPAEPAEPDEPAGSDDSDAVCLTTAEPAAAGRARP